MRLGAGLPGTTGDCIMQAIETTVFTTAALVAQMLVIAAILAA